MYVYRFFLRLKYQYLNGVRNHRLDDLIQCLLGRASTFQTIMSNLRDVGRAKLKKTQVLKFIETDYFFISLFIPANVPAYGGRLHGVIVSPFSVKIEEVMSILVNNTKGGLIIYSGGIRITANTGRKSYAPPP